MNLPVNARLKPQLGALNIQNIQRSIKMSLNCLKMSEPFFKTNVFLTSLGYWQITAVSAFF